jgi:ABC-type lipoprotein export system ATPase subunit
MPFRPIGSVWGKWDLHFHTPSSYDYANKSITDAQIVDRLIQAGIVAVAITDHHLIDANRIRSLQSLGGEKLTIFPGIELRSELGGSESVHLIGIFSEYADPEYIWTKMQGKLNLTTADVQRKGDDRIYVRFEEAAELIHDLEGIVSVHVGRKSNSIESIGNDHPYKQAFKEDLARDHIDLFEIGRPADVVAYRKIVFPAIGLERPLIICSDNHDVNHYVVKASCWIKSDPAFVGFQQIISDPQERAYIGEIPPSVEKERKNATKYMSSISFEKLPGSSLSEHWFSGTVPLNPGLIAVIGNKGTGKTALVESIGLLGSTAQHDHFSFLNDEKFRQPKNNKAKHFKATLKWDDGSSSFAVLAEPVDPESLESVSYIPQNYLEVICNEIQSSTSRFDKELKSVIFSHVDETDRLGADTLDELLKFLTDQTHARLNQLREELSAINQNIIELERRGSKESRQLLLNLVDEKKRELEAHEKAKPTEIPKPATDPENRRHLEDIAKQIEAKQVRRSTITTEVKKCEAEMKTAALRQAVSERVLGRLRNFEAQYDKFVADATADCIELSLSARALVKVEIDKTSLTKILDEARTAAEASRKSKTELEEENKGLQEDIDQLTQQLDAPNVHYQNYLQQLELWKQERSRIIGEENQTGSINYLSRQIQDLDGIPAKLASSIKEREQKVREIYRELQKLVSTYKSLYNPVQKFIEEHSLAAGKFSFQFEASITYSGLENELFSLVNQARRGSFSGSDEGRRVLKNLAVRTDFNVEDDAVRFCINLLDHLERDRRESSSPKIPISDQLKKGATELQLLNCIFALNYLLPRYSLKWSGKSIEELSPGERGTLLLIFYLLIDRRETPLVIDQPEENLDNHTVYDLLVPCIKEARKKRQVVIVTHNPNLAVVCDADQVIHCSIDKQSGNRVTYTTGALENPAINQYTIDVLEGTRPAFDLRDSKYQSDV